MKRGIELVEMKRTARLSGKIDEYKSLQEVQITTKK